jgi:hypothetical protein
VSGGALTAADWEAVRPTLRGMARAVFSPATFVASTPGNVRLGLPNDTHRTKCEQHRSVVEQALAAHAGTAIAVELVVEGGGGSSGPTGGGGGGGETTVMPATRVETSPSSQGPVRGESASMSAGSLAHDTVPHPASEPASEPAPDAAHLSVVPPTDTHVANGRAIAEQARSQGPEPDPDEGLQTFAEALPEDDDVDLDDLIDAPPEAVKTPVDRLAEAFPGSELIDDPY